MFEYIAFHKNGWLLMSVNKAYPTEWRNYKVLYICPKSTAEVAEIGWNGERLAKNDRTEKLQREHPDIVKWIISTLMEQVSNELQGA